MEYEINLRIKVDPEAPFIESDPSTTKDVLEEMFGDLLYDLDDIEVTELSVREIE